MRKTGIFYTNLSNLTDRQRKNLIAQSSLAVVGNRLYTTHDLGKYFIFIRLLSDIQTAKSKRAKSNQKLSQLLEQNYLPAIDNLSFW